MNHHSIDSADDSKEKYNKNRYKKYKMNEDSIHTLSVPSNVGFVHFKTLHSLNSNKKILEVQNDTLYNYKSLQLFTPNGVTSVNTQMKNNSMNSCYVDLVYRNGDPKNIYTSQNWSDCKRVSQFIRDFFI